MKMGLFAYFPWIKTHKWLTCRILGLILLSLVGLTIPAQAHWADLAVAEIDVKDAEVQVTLTIPTGLVAAANDQKNGHLSAAEIRAHSQALAALLGPKIQLTDGQGRPGTLTVAPADAGALPSDVVAPARTHSTLLLLYKWEAPVRQLDIQYDLFIPGVSTARCLATIFYGGKTYSFVFTPEQKRFGLGSHAIWQNFTSFLELGIEHIITGYDHILFLISLLMLGGGIRYLLEVVTAFTIAHSITLSLAVLDVVRLPSRWVESAIALSIIYVAAENFWRKDLHGRWRITFCFGLIHGLGFASVLKEMNLPQVNLAISLVSFNLGVEVGQVFIVSIAYLTLQALRRYSWEPVLRQWVSAGVICMATFWFFQRAFFTA